MKASHADLYYPVFHKNKPRECYKLNYLHCSFLLLFLIYYLLFLKIGVIDAQKRHLNEKLLFYMKTELLNIKF